MPADNQFQHQQYPTTPADPIVFRTLNSSDGQDADFSALHLDCGVGKVVIVHGTFMGDDSFGIAEILRSFSDDAPRVIKKMLVPLTKKLQQQAKSLVNTVAGDIGNYTPEFRTQFQKLVGDDPSVELLTPTWSGQNHHLARIDLAVRLLCLIDDYRPDADNRLLLWGHSHAGNAFALLTNLLANHRPTVRKLFKTADESYRKRPQWRRAAEILAQTPGRYPLAEFVDIAAFGTPVRYGWDTAGYGRLLHVLHHRVSNDNRPERTHPLFPLHTVIDMTNARYGDWVQAFAIAGTDTSRPNLKKPNERMSEILESGLAEPQHALDTRFLPSQRVRNACARWKTGTRCHTDGTNFLVDYEPGGRLARLVVPVEDTLFGHGVATTLDWLPAHLKLVCEGLLAG